MAYLVDEHNDNILLREKGVEAQVPRGGVQAATHVGVARPAHAWVQDVAVQLRIDQLLQQHRCSFYPGRTSATWQLVILRLSSPGKSAGD